MKSFYEVKTVANSVKDVDAVSRRVKVVISEMGSKDLDGDVIDPAAYNRTIKERGPAGANLIWHLTDHDTSLKLAVGKFKELYTQGTQLVGVTDIPKTSWGNDVLEFYNSGTINQHSIGFKTIKSEAVNSGKTGGYNLIKEVLLYEGSAVLWAANPATPMISVGKSLSKKEKEEEFNRLNNNISSIFKSLKDGKYSDNTFELLEIRLTQTQEQMKQLILFSPGGANTSGSEDLSKSIAKINSLFKDDGNIAKGLKGINDLFK